MDFCGDDCMDKSKIGVFIKKLRQEKGWNQEKLASLLFCDRSRISKIENGSKIPAIEDFIKLGELFHISFEEIISGERKTKTNEKIIQNNLKEYILLSAKNLKKRNLIILILTTFLIVTFLGITIIYFIQNYSSIKIYKFYGSSENYKINNGLLIISKEKIYLDIKNISPETDKIEIISEINNEKQIVYKGDYRNILNDFYGYSNIISYDDFVEQKQKIYVKIEQEEIELNFVEDFTNDNIFYLKEDIIGSNEEINHNYPEKVLKNFKCDKMGCFLKNKTESLSFIDNIFILQKDNSEYFYDVNNKVFEYHKFPDKDDREILFSYSDNGLVCEISDCKNYKEIYENFKINYLEKYIY